MKRREAIAGAGIALSTSLAGCVDDLLGGRVTEAFSSSHSVTAETVVAVTNSNGPVTVQKTSGDELTVSGEKRARSQEALDSIVIDVSEGERVVVNVRFGGGNDFSNRSVDLTVEVPAGVSVDRANTANGDVTVDGVHGDLAATTSNGTVDIQNVNGFVRGETANGNVTVRNTTGLTGATTTNGAVDVELRAMRGDVTCRSSNGDVTARVGPDVTTGFRLSTNNGNAAVNNLSHTTSVDRTGYIVGALHGADSPTLFLATNNGDVTLRPV